jgi:site-specific DNA-methyltransferase (adenine-specific)
MKIIELAIGKLKPYNNNPRQISDKSVDAVAASIDSFGFKVPIVIDINNEIVAGHTRYKAAVKLGLNKVPCIVAGDLTPKQIQAYRLADNKVAELSEWDIDKLNIELDDIDFDMSVFGFDEEQPDTDDLENIIQDDIPEAPEPTTQLGDVYALDKHRLICGDCTNQSTLKELLDGATADLVCTDPPYNTDIANVLAGVSKGRDKNNKDPLKNIRKYNANNLANDNITTEQYAIFLDKAFGSIDGVLKQGGALYVFYALSEQGNVHSTFAKHFKLYQYLIWVKQHFVLSHADYHYRHEPIIYGYKLGAGHYFTSSRSEDTVIDDSIDISALKKMNKQELFQLAKDLMQRDQQPTTVLYEDKPARSEDHPTIKPVKLFARLIRNSSRAQEIVLDPFAGSGTTMMAAEQLGRRAYMCELEPKYCDIIVARWEQFTGQKAVKLSG